MLINKVKLNYELVSMRAGGSQLKDKSFLLKQQLLSMVLQLEENDNNIEKIFMHNCEKVNNLNINDHDCCFTTAAASSRSLPIPFILSTAARITR